jgi:hypothetical protein
MLLTLPAHPRITFSGMPMKRAGEPVVGVLDNGTDCASIPPRSFGYGGVESARHRYAYIWSTAPSEPQQLFLENLRRWWF